MDTRLQRYLAEAQNIINNTPVTSIPVVDIICCTYRTNQTINVFQQINSQKVRIGRVIFCVQDYEQHHINLLQNNIKNANVVIIKANKNDSLGERHNQMMEHTKADYIAIMDDDDLYCPNYLKQQLSYLVSKSADATSICNPIGRTSPGNSYGFLFKMFRSGDSHPGAGGSIVFNRKAWERSGGFEDVREGYDYDFLKGVIGDPALVHVETPPFNFAVTRSTAGNNTWQLSPAIEGDYRMNILDKNDIPL